MSLKKKPSLGDAASSSTIISKFNDGTCAVFANYNTLGSTCFTLLQNQVLHKGESLAWCLESLALNVQE